MPAASPATSAAAASRRARRPAGRRARPRCRAGAPHQGEGAVQRLAQDEGADPHQWRVHRRDPAAAAPARAPAARGARSTPISHTTSAPTIACAILTRAGDDDGSSCDRHRSASGTAGRRGARPNSRRRPGLARSGIDEARGPPPGSRASARVLALVVGERLAVPVAQAECQAEDETHDRGAAPAGARAAAAVASRHGRALLPALEAQRGDLFGDQADEEHDDGEHDEQHGAVGILCVRRDRPQRVARPRPRTATALIGRNTRSGLKIVTILKMMRKNFAPSRASRIFDVPTRAVAPRSARTRRCSPP